MQNCGRPATKDILKNLVIMIPTFYMVLYCVSSITHAIYGLSFRIRAPFYIDKCCLEDSFHQVTGISLIMTYFISTFLYILVTTVFLWDHIATVSIFHVLLTSAVMVEFPTNWQWWVALAIGAVTSIIFGESLSFCIRKRKSRKSGSARVNQART